MKSCLISSGDEIVPGQADSITVDLGLGTWFEPPLTWHSHYGALVQIDIERDRTEDLGSGQRQLAKQWKSVTNRSDLGLREYMRPGDDGGWGYRTYVPIDPDVKTPKGGMIVYNCAGPSGKEPERCRTQYQHHRGRMSNTP